MKTWTITILFVIALLFTACQSSMSTPTSQPSKIPLPSATIAPSSTATPTAITVKSVYVTAFCTSIGKDLTTHVQQGTPVIITWGWDAKTETQINDYLQNNITTITLDGKIIEGKMNDKIMNNKGLLEVVWLSEVGVLNPGQHTVTYDVKWKKMIDDGTNTYGPGSKNETEHDECQIIVE